MLGPVSYRITSEDYLSFCLLVQRAHMRNFFVFIAALVVIITVVAFVSDMTELAIGGAVGGLVAIIVVPLVIRVLILPHRAEKAYREYRLMHEEMTLELSDEGFSIEQKSGRVALDWVDVVYWNENDRVIGIHPTRHLGYILPKEQIGRDHAEFVRRRLAMHGLPEKGVMRAE